MNTQYARISATLFAAVALVQVIRAVNSWPVTINGVVVPVAVSWIIALITGALCVWGWRTTR